MTMNDIISAVMRANKVTQQKLAEAIGKKRATDVGSRLNTTNMTMNNAVEMLDALGYQIVVRPKALLKTGEYEVTHTKGFKPINTFPVIASPELTPADKMVMRVNESLSDLIAELNLETHN